MEVVDKIFEEESSHMQGKIDEVKPELEKWIDTDSVPFDFNYFMDNRQSQRDLLAEQKLERLQKTQNNVFQNKEEVDALSRQYGIDQELYQVDERQLPVNLCSVIKRAFLNYKSHGSMKRTLDKMRIKKQQPLSQLNQSADNDTQNTMSHVLTVGDTYESQISIFSPKLKKESQVEVIKKVGGSRNDFVGSSLNISARIDSRIRLNDLTPAEQNPLKTDESMASVGASPFKLKRNELSKRSFEKPKHSRNLYSLMESVEAPRSSNKTTKFKSSDKSRNFYLSPIKASLPQIKQNLKSERKETMRYSKRQRFGLSILEMDIPEKHSLEKVMFNCNDYLQPPAQSQSPSRARFSIKSVYQSNYRNFIDSIILSERLKADKAIQVAERLQALQELKPSLVYAFYKDNQQNSFNDNINKQRLIDEFMYRKIDTNYFRMLERKKGGARIRNKTVVNTDIL